MWCEDALTRCAEREVEVESAEVEARVSRGDELFKLRERIELRHLYVAS